MAVVSRMDRRFHGLCRSHIENFIQKTAQSLSVNKGRLLEIGPRDPKEMLRHFRNYACETFDIVDSGNPTYVGDITKCNQFIRKGTFDCIVCMEVLEHVLDPFAAIREIHRILKRGGFLLMSTPLNFRIHGPIPDCWRFTEHGLKVLLRDFEIVEIDILETPKRDLFPLHYNVLARADRHRDKSDADLQFRFIE